MLKPRLSGIVRDQRIGEIAGYFARIIFTL